mmetsp:Transcript_57820/g.122619  ORF Transcript_57820/g.122619 Transcript_57820/m.122619 type:complete len:208 (+) Transcript_57820:218-841(+)
MAVFSQRLLHQLPPSPPDIETIATAAPFAILLSEFQPRRLFISHGVQAIIADSHRVHLFQSAPVEILDQTCHALLEPPRRDFGPRRGERIQQALRMKTVNVGHQHAHFVILRFLVLHVLGGDGILHEGDVPRVRRNVSVRPQTVRSAKQAHPARVHPRCTRGLQPIAPTPQDLLHPRARRVQRELAIEATRPLLPLPRRRLLRGRRR